MKKFNLLTVSACAFAFLMSAEAKDLSQDGKLYINDGMGNVITTVKSYDSVNDINKVNVTVKINEDLIEHILNQAPGNPSSSASMGAYYMTFTPEDMKNKTLKKESIWLSKGANASEHINELKIADADLSTNPSFYPFGLRIEYFDGTSWIRVKNKSNGGLTIAQNLVNLLHLQNRNELKYGENYRFYMNEDRDLLIGWQNVNDDSDKEYVLVTYDVKFSIAAKTSSDTYAYYPDIDSALASGNSEIIINENLEINHNIVIPKDVTLKVAENVKLTVLPNIKVENNGKVEVSGNIEGNILANYTKLEEIEAIVKNLDESLYTEESLQELKTAMSNVNKELRYDEQEKLDKMVKNIEVALNNLKKLESDQQKPIDSNKVEIENPKTADNILLYISSLLLAVLGLKVSLKYLKKHN